MILKQPDMLRRVQEGGDREVTVIPASWSRMEGNGVPPKFYDAGGKEIVFNQGKTWIRNIWEEYSEYVEFE